MEAFAADIAGFMLNSDTAQLTEEKVLERYEQAHVVLKDNPDHDPVLLVKKNFDVCKK